MKTLLSRSPHPITQTLLLKICIDCSIDINLKLLTWSWSDPVLAWIQFRTRHRLLKSLGNLSIFFTGYGLALEVVSVPANRTSQGLYPRIGAAKQSMAHIHPPVCQVLPGGDSPWAVPCLGTVLAIPNQSWLSIRDNFGAGLQSVLCFIYKYGPNLWQHKPKSCLCAPEQ